MAEEPTLQAAVTVEPPKETPPEPPEKTVPYDRFAEVNQQAKEAKAAQKKLEDRLQELEDRDKSELEQERNKRERAEAELQSREQRLVSLERGGWVRDAAVEANFKSPGLAPKLVDLSEIESEADAKKAIKKVAADFSELVQAEQPTPQIGRVLANGQPVDPNAPSPQDEENEEFLAELKAANAKGWSPSGAGMLD